MMQGMEAMIMIAPQLGQPGIIFLRQAIEPGEEVGSIMGDERPLHSSGLNLLATIGIAPFLQLLLVQGTQFPLGQHQGVFQQPQGIGRQVGQATPKFRCLREC